MSPLLAYGLIGAGGAVISRWCHLSRLIGGCMIVVGGVALASPAFADEHVLARDNSEVACTMSKSGLTGVAIVRRCAMLGAGKSRAIGIMV